MQQFSLRGIGKKDETKKNWSYIARDVRMHLCQKLLTTCLFVMLPLFLNLNSKNGNLPPFYINSIQIHPLDSKIG